MKTLVLANQKGGSGKTTTAANLAGALAEAGQRVLAIDFDPQAQLAGALGSDELIRYTDSGILESATVAELIRPSSRTSPGASLADAVLKTPFDGLDLVPGSSALDELRGSLEADPAGRSALRRAFSADALASAGLEYDWLIIDTAPKLDILLDNALVASDYVLAVLAPEWQQAEPLSRFVGRLRVIQENLKPELELLGVLFNKANFDWVATGAIPQELASIGMPVLETVIPMYSRLANGYGRGPVVFVAPNSREAGVVRTAVAEIIQRVQDRETVTA